MKRVIFLLMGLGLISVHAESLQGTIDRQQSMIKQLKREVAIKDQEIKILLITLKNAQQESMIASSGQKLEFNNVSNVSPTRVVLKSSMLSESAIKEINKYQQTDTDTLSGMNAPKKLTEPTTVSHTGSEVKKATDSCNFPIQYIKASKFELIKEGKVYYEVGGSNFELWPEGKRFTSNKKRGPWILVTGQITRDGWTRSSQELWISENDVQTIQ